MKALDAERDLKRFGRPRQSLAEDPTNPETLSRKDLRRFADSDVLQSLLLNDPGDLDGPR